MARKRQQGTAADDAGETLRLIVKTAHRLFMESGYRAVSTRQIAQACGLTQPALYHYFKDKQALYEEVLRSTMNETRTALERLIRRYTEDLEECLRQIVLYFLMTKPDDLFRMFHDIEHELSAEARERISSTWMQSYLLPVASVFEEGLRRGTLLAPGQGGTDPVSAAYLLMSFVSHSGGPQDASVRADTLVRVLLYGIAAERT